MLAITEKSKLLRGVATVCGAAILHTILLTFSRGAFLGLLVVGAMAFLMLPKRPVYVLAMIAALLLTVRLVGPQLASRYSTTFVEAGSRDASAASRVDLWRDCLDTAIKNPIFGVGPRNWPLIASSYGWPAGKEAHSVWMQTLAETGFVGVSLLAFFFGATIVLLWPVARARIAPENRLEAGVATGVVLAVVGFAVAGQFVSLTGLETPYYMTLVGVVLLKSRSLQAMTTVVAPPAPAQTPPAPITIRIPPRARLTPEPLATRRSTG
jgi:O-antigen ligase